MPDTETPAKTLYVVLQKLPDRTREHIPGLAEEGADVDITSFNSSNTEWREITRVNARSAEEAIRVVADKTDAAKEGSIVALAVPASSWKPRTVKVETTTRVRLEDA